MFRLIVRCVLSKQEDINSDTSLKNAKGRITAADFKLHSDLVSGKRFFYQMKRYIYDHFETVALDELSDRFYMSTTYISRYLKDKLHSGFSDILKDAGIDKAKELLIKTDLPILQIAQDVGYSSQSHFIQLFHKSTGQSPLQYRSTKRSSG